jgi:large subunit ribosomal protein L3
MRGLIAKKIGMTRVVSDGGQMVAVTLLEVVDQKVTKVLTPERDGYHGIQVGYYQKKEHRLSKPDITRLRKVSVSENYSKFKEFRLDGPGDGLQLGVKLDVARLGEAVTLDVTGLTKGHGFEGAITRWGHKTGRRTHGSHFHRRPGSLGQRTTPGRVMKNKQMPGHMGTAQRTIQNLKVMDIDSETSVIAVKGSVPGHRDGYVLVQPSVKAKQA